MSSNWPILCPKCEAEWRANGKLSNMELSGTFGNPCDVCGSSAQSTTQFMPAAERARFDAEMEAKSKKMEENNR